MTSLRIEDQLTVKQEAHYTVEAYHLCPLEKVRAFDGRSTEGRISSSISVISVGQDASYLCFLPTPHVTPLKITTEPRQNYGMALTHVIHRR